MLAVLGALFARIIRSEAGGGVMTALSCMMAERCTRLAGPTNQVFCFSACFYKLRRQKSTVWLGKITLSVFIAAIYFGLVP